MSGYHWRERPLPPLPKPPTGSKYCPRCGEVKPVEEFNRDRRTGRQGRCRPCQNATSRAYYRQNRELILVQKRRKRMSTQRAPGLPLDRGLA